MTVKFNEMAELVTLMNTDIPEGRNNLLESHANLERVAEYCEGNYLQAEDKTAALEETKNYMTQSLASVAYQINTLAYSFLQMLDLQSAQMSEMEVQISHINQMVMIHKEKVARREIGVLTTNKCSTRQYKILAPANQERPIKYVRRPIDFSILDDIGHGVRVPSEMPRQKQRASSQGSTSSLIGPPGGSPQPMTGTLKGHSPVPPAPTSKPPTPPQLRAVGTGSLTKGSREYRTPPAVAPPQVPSNYAPNYPIGHPRRDRNSSGYRTLPMPVNSMGANATYAPSQPQVGMVHPMAHAQGSMTLRESGTYGTGLERQRSYSNPPPPSPGVLVGDMSDYGMELPPEATRPVSMSPPPPPPPIEEELMRGGAEQIYAPGVRRGVLPADEDLPGWVPKNYIEKVVALYDYYADKEDELSFQENSVIYVLRKNDDGWWEGVMDGITGLFPGNYVEPCM